MEDSLLVLWTIAGGEVATWTLRDGRSVDVGSAPTSGLRLPSPELADHAARLTAAGERLRVERLGSTAVLLNGVQITGVETARPGDVLTLGGTTLAVGRRSTQAVTRAPGPLPADLFELKIDEVVRSQSPGTIALFIPAPGLREPLYAHIREDVPQGSLVFGLGRSLAVWSGDEAWRPSGSEKVRVSVVSVLSECLCAERLLATLFTSALGHEDSEPVFADPVTIALAQVVTQLFAREGASCVFEGGPASGKTQLARWAMGVGGERVIALDEEGLQKLASGGRWIVQGVSREARELVARSGAHALFVNTREEEALREVKALSEEAGVLWIPPLRDRPLDVDPLIDWCVLRARRALGRAELALAAEVREALRTYAWPGNVAELEATVLRACLVAASDRVGMSDLPSRLQGLRNADVAPLREAMAEQERAALLEALAQTGWNVTRAAELLALPRRTVVWRMARLNLRRPRES